jgi:hypothetical protein
MSSNLGLTFEDVDDNFLAGILKKCEHLPDDSMLKQLATEEKERRERGQFPSIVNRSFRGRGRLEKDGAIDWEETNGASAKSCPDANPVERAE